MSRRTATATTTETDTVSVVLYPGGHAVADGTSAFYGSGIIHSITVDVMGTPAQVDVYNMATSAGAPLSLGTPAKKFHTDP